MRCPKCKRSSTIVTDSRYTKGGRRRRRECPRCDHRFHTLEQVVATGRQSAKYIIGVDFARCADSLVMVRMRVAPDGSLSVVDSTVRKGKVRKYG